MYHKNIIVLNKRLVSSVLIRECFSNSYILFLLLLFTNIHMRDKTGKHINIQNGQYYIYIYITLPTTCFLLTRCSHINIFADTPSDMIATVS